MGIVEGKGKMRLTKKRADNGRYYLSGLAEVLNSYPKGYGLIQVGHAVDKLAEYEDLEEQSRLLKLPCAVGDTVYYLDRFCSGTSLDCPCKPCESCEDYKLEIYEGKFKLNDINDFEKTVFLTKEEAEAALKELERGKGK